MNEALTKLKLAKNPVSVIAKFEDCNFNFEGQQIKKGTVELVKEADGSFGWRELAKENSFYENIDEFKTAIARGENVFYIGKHSDITPRPTGVQSHHGVNSVWMESNYSNYVPDDAPTIYMLNDPNHNVTRGVFNTWRSEMTKIQGTSTIDYSKVTKDEILKLSERQFDAANVPKTLREEYYRRWEEYLKTLKKK